MRITKAMHSPTTGKTTVEYEHKEHEGKDAIASVLQTDDAPHKDFLSALEALKPEVEELCELPEGFLSDVRGVTIHRTESDDGSETVTVTFTATKKIGESRSPLVLNTPAVLLEDGSGAHALVKEAVKFLQGHRAQGELPLGGPVEQPKVAKAKAHAVPKAEPAV